MLERSPGMRSPGQGWHQAQQRRRRRRQQEERYIPYSVQSTIMGNACLSGGEGGREPGYGSQRDTGWLAGLEGKWKLERPQKGDTTREQVCQYSMYTNRSPPGGPSRGRATPLARPPVTADGCQR